MAAAAELIRGADAVDGGRLHRDGEPLTAETGARGDPGGLRAARRAGAAGVMVVSALSGGGHDPGSGRCPRTCRSRSTCGRATRRAAAGPT